MLKLANYWLIPAIIVILSYVSWNFIRSAFYLLLVFTSFALINSMFERYSISKRKDLLKRTTFPPGLKLDINPNISPKLYSEIHEHCDHRLIGPDPLPLHELICCFESIFPNTLNELSDHHESQFSTREFLKQYLKKFYYKVMSVMETKNLFLVQERIYTTICYNLKEFIENGHRSRSNITAEEEIKLLEVLYDSIHEHLSSNSQLRLFTTTSASLRLLLRAFFINQLIRPFINHMCSPSWINQQLIVEASARSLTEKIAQHFREAIHWQFSSFPARDYLNILNSSQKCEPMTWQEKWKHAESLIKFVKRCRTVLDARSVVFSTTVELSRIGKRHFMENLDRYEKQLLLVKQKYEKRITYLSMQLQNGRESTRTEFDTRKAFTSPASRVGTPEALDLKSMLLDYHSKSSENLFYFLRFLEDSDNGLKVQFWLDVETLKERVFALENPLTDEEVRKEAAKIHDRYIKFIHSFLHPSTIFAIKQFINDERTSPISPEFAFEDSETSAGIDAIFQAQDEIQKDMELHDFPEFLKSNSYFKWVGDDVHRNFSYSEIENDSEGEYTVSADSNMLQPDQQVLRIPNESKLLHASSQTFVAPDLDYEKSDMYISIKRCLKGLLNRPEKLPEISAMVQENQEGSVGVSLLSPMIRENEQNLTSRKLEPHSFQSSSSSVSGSKQEKYRFLSPPGSSSPVKQSFINLSPANSPNLMPLPPSSLMNFVPIQARLDALNQQLGLLDFMILRERESGKRKRMGLIPYEKVLRKTKELIRIELAELVEQKMIEQANDKDIVKWMVSMTPSTAPKDTVYFLDVTMEDTKSGLTSSWIVPRRFTEFHDMHLRLKEKYPIVQGFSGKLFQNRFTLHKSKAELMVEKQVGLSRYLALLVEHHDISQSEILKEFLSDRKLKKRNKKDFRKAEKLSRLLDLDSNSGKLRQNSSLSASFSSIFRSPKEQKPLFEHITLLENSDYLPNSSMGSQTRSYAGSPYSKDSLLPGDVTQTDASSNSEFDGSDSEEVDQIFEVDSNVDALIDEETQDEDAATIGKMETDQDTDTKYSKWDQNAVSEYDQTDKSYQSNTDIPIVINLSPGLTEGDKNIEITALTKPLCDLMLTVFEFPEQNDLLREAAALLLLKKGVFGNRKPASVEVHVKNMLNSLVSPQTILKYLTKLTDWFSSRQNAGYSQHKIADPSHQQLKALLESPSPDSDDLSLEIKVPAGKEDMAIWHPDFDTEDGYRYSSQYTKQLRQQAFNSLPQFAPSSFIRLLGETETVDGLRRLFETVQDKSQSKACVYKCLEACVKELLRIK